MLGKEVSADYTKIEDYIRQKRSENEECSSESSPNGDSDSTESDLDADLEHLHL